MVSNSTTGTEICVLIVRDYIIIAHRAEKRKDFGAVFLGRGCGYGVRMGTEMRESGRFDTKQQIITKCEIDNHNILWYNTCTPII